MLIRFFNKYIKNCVYFNMFTLKSDKNDFPKNTGKKYKVLINAGGGLFRLCNYKLYELFRL